jgi:hypothetical protein
MVGAGLSLKIGLEPSRAKAKKEPSKLDADIELLKERIQQFGRGWAVTAAAAGSADPGCLLQAAKALSGLVALFGERKAAAYKSQTRCEEKCLSPARGGVAPLLVRGDVGGSTTGVCRWYAHGLGLFVSPPAHPRQQLHHWVACIHTGTPRRRRHGGGCCLRCCPPGRPAPRRWRCRRWLGWWGTCPR